MTDNAVYIVTGILAVLALYLFFRTFGSSQSLTKQKAAEVARKRAALMAKRKAEAAAQEKSSE